MTERLNTPYQSPFLNLLAQFFNDGFEVHFAEFAVFATVNGNGIILTIRIGPDTAIYFRRS